VSEKEDPLVDPDLRAWLDSAVEVVMPPEVAARVHDALAREAANRAQAEPASESPAEPAVLRLPARQPAPSRAGRWLLAASVAALAVLGSAALVGLLGEGDDSDTAAIGGNQAEMRDDAGDASAPEESRVQGLDSGSESEQLMSALPPVPADLLSLVDDPSTTAANSGCGSRLAAEQIGEPVRAVVADEGVLVVLQQSSEDTVWWLPSCTSLAVDALGRSPLP
jgi:hypothetical protein